MNSNQQGNSGRPLQQQDDLTPTTQTAGSDSTQQLNVSISFPFGQFAQVEGLDSQQTLELLRGATVRLTLSLELPRLSGNTVEDVSNLGETRIVPAARSQQVIQQLLSNLNGQLGELLNSTSMKNSLQENHVVQSVDCVNLEENEIFEEENSYDDSYDSIFDDPDVDPYDASGEGSEEDSDEDSEDDLNQNPEEDSDENEVQDAIDASNEQTFSLFKLNYWTSSYDRNDSTSYEAVYIPTVHTLPWPKWQHLSDAVSENEGTSDKKDDEEEDKQEEKEEDKEDDETSEQ